VSCNNSYSTNQIAEFYLIAYLVHDAYKMAVHCEKFDEERAERVIKNSVQELVKCSFCVSEMCFPFCPLDLENALFRPPPFGI